MGAPHFTKLNKRITVAIQLTVIIPCKDEAHNIQACIESVRGLGDEILVADSGSTDGTLEIVNQMGGCRIIEREYVNSADFKNWAIPQATHPWVLIVDADERVTGELAAEIHSLLAGTPALDAYRMDRQNYFLGHRIKHSGWNSATVTRLFRRAVCRYTQRRVHADVEVASGKIGKLKGKFLHYTCHDLRRYIAKLNRYTTWSAQDMYEAGRRVGYLGLLLRPPARFWQFYIWRGGFLDGAAGLVVCMTMACYTVMKYAKLWELRAASSAESEQRGAQAPQSGPHTHPAETDPRSEVNKAA
jgi:glycosyltransferase involved in cell wall biosynthesis